MPSNSSSAVRHDAAANEDTSVIRERILHLLDIYIVVTPTMIQGSLGSAIKPAVWKEVMHHLCDEGLVIQDQTPSIVSPAGRYQTYKRLYLARNAEVVQQYSCVDAEGAEGNV